MRYERLPKKKHPAGALLNETRETEPAFSVVFYP
jgi:hypothetical protein